MTEFHEGQEVEIRLRAGPRDDLGGFQIAWCKAKIVNSIWHVKEHEFRWRVQFPDGSRAVFDAEHIRAIGPKVAWDECGSMVIAS